jgi:hypothetical protein
VRVELRPALRLIASMLLLVWPVSRTIGNLGFGVPSFGSINPALVAMYDPAIGEKSAQRYQPDSARELLAKAGFPGGEGMRPLVSTIIADERRRWVVDDLIGDADLRLAPVADQIPLGAIYEGSGV